MNKSWKTYRAGDFFDELITDKGSPRVAARQAVNLLQRLSREEMDARRSAAERPLVPSLPSVPSSPS